MSKFLLDIPNKPLLGTSSECSGCRAPISTGKQSFQNIERDILIITIEQFRFLRS